jgi:hypothetical protein
MSYEPVLVELNNVLLSINKELNNYEDSYRQYKELFKTKHDALIMIRKEIEGIIKIYEKLIDCKEDIQ